MQKSQTLILVFFFLTGSLFSQTKRLWVLRAPGEMVEYDSASFAFKQTVKVPPEVLKSPAHLQVNRSGQMLFAPPISLPLSEDDAASPHKLWIWNGRAATTIDLPIERKLEDRGSNKQITEKATALFLSADGAHLFWSANEAERLEREEIDLSTETRWQAWLSDLQGGRREEVGTQKLPDCRCTTGSCEETCPTGVVWAPSEGVENFFLLTLYVAGQTGPSYKGSVRYYSEDGKWKSNALAESLQRVLGAASGGTVIVEAIPDTGCCGWSNQSDDQTLVLANGKNTTIFDELTTYKNPDYDVSFFTGNARLSPDGDAVAMTITATAKPNSPIQLAQQGQASPEESQSIRKSLEELPAVVIKSIEDTPKQIAFVPHATLVGWLNQKELLLVEDHLLVSYHVGTGAHRKTPVRVEDASHVFLR